MVVLRQKATKKGWDYTMADMEKREQAEMSVRALGKSAAVSVVTLEETSLSDQFAYTAEAICRAYGLDGSVMEEFRQEVAKAEDSSWADGIPYQDAENARDLIYEMCDRLTDPKEIMRHVRNASEMLYVWVPMPAI